MKTTIFAIAALCAVLVSGHSYAQADKLNPGAAIPGADIAMKSTAGKSVTLKSAMGENGLLVMFSCNTCPFVVKNQATTRATMQYAIVHHIGMVIINSNEAQRGNDDSYEAMKTYAKDQGYVVPYLMDEQSKLADMFGANHTPEIFLFNKKGVLEYKGAMNDNPSDPSAAKKQYINNAIDAVVSGGNIDPKVTKSVGCSIKRKA